MKSHPAFFICCTATELQFAGHGAMVGLKYQNQCLKRAGPTSAAVLRSLLGEIAAQGLLVRSRHCPSPSQRTAFALQVCQQVCNGVESQFELGVLDATSASALPVIRADRPETDTHALFRPAIPHSPKAMRNGIDAWQWTNCAGGWLTVPPALAHWCRASRPNAGLHPSSPCTATLQPLVMPRHGLRPSPCAARQ